MWCRVVLAKQETIVCPWGTPALLLPEQPVCSKDSHLHYLVILRHNFVWDNVVSWSLFCLQRSSGSASAVWAGRGAVVSPHSPEATAGCQLCCLPGLRTVSFHLFHQFRKWQKMLGKLQENFQALMGERTKWTQKALFWLMGANGENTSGVGEVGTVGEVALGWPIACRQQGALQVLGTGSLLWDSLPWASPHPCPGVLWSVYLPGLSGAAEVQRSVESLAQVRSVYVKRNFVPSPKLKTVFVGRT